MSFEPKNYERVQMIYALSLFFIAFIVGVFMAIPLRK